MEVLNFSAVLGSGEPQYFSNPYDAMASLIGVDGEAMVYVDNQGTRVPLLRRDSEGSWESA